MSHFRMGALIVVWACGLALAVVVGFEFAKHVF
jgi:hypothetical protein